MQKSITSLADIPEIAAYLSRVGAEPRSLRLAVVREQHGKYWRDIARISFNPEVGVVKVYGDEKLFAPNADEQKAIAAALPNYRFPQSKRVLHYTLPPQLQSVDPENIFPFKDRDGQLIMLVVRSERKGSNDKVYKPWTLFDDDEWRSTEPDGKLPLFNLENLETQHTTVFIHEGPKAARTIHRLIHPHTDNEREAYDAHPWIVELAQPDTCHLGWHGGALNPHRTDWSVLKRAGVKRVIIVADNDAPGVQAVPKIASELTEMRVHTVRFDKTFPPSFDMADKLPDSFYDHTNGGRYKGPSFDNLLTPATWATEVIPQGKKEKPIIKLRPEFKDQWMWCRDQDLYVNIDRPSMCFDQKTFDNAVAPFSDVKATSKLLLAEWSCHASRLTYRPDTEARVLNEDAAPVVVNTYRPSRIHSASGNSQPWEDFLEHLIVLPDERHEVKRWCATLIAHPEIRMTYSLLLASERQGVGKTTLGEQVLAPLVGIHNTSFPSERTIVDSQFNSWVAEKRLVVVGEIYSGKSWKAYQNLKSYVSDKHIEVNKKFMPAYTLMNWAHFICSSNSMRALKIEDTDRRWYIPEVTERQWGEGKFGDFRRWLRSGGGLGIILHWAQQFGDYVAEGVHPPDTARKREMAEESMPEPVKLLVAWCEAHGGAEMIVSDRAIKQWLQSEKQNPEHLTAKELRNAMQKLGWKNPGIQISLDGFLQFTMMSPKLYPKWVGLNGASDKDRREWIRSNVRPMVDASDRSM